MPIKLSKLPEWVRNLSHDWPIHIPMLIGLFIAFIPIFFMISISFKSLGQFITQPLGITTPIDLSNYVIAFNVLKRSFLNSVGMTTFVVIFSLLISALAAYAFAMFRFPGREILYWMVIGVLFVPGILIFTTRYTIADSLGMLNTYWVLVVPYIAGSQVFQAVVLRSFFEGVSSEILDSARVDGAGVLTVFWRIVIPMSRPILAALMILRAIEFWDEWVWAGITISNRDLRPMAYQIFFLSSDIGQHVPRQMAGYALAILPMLILFIFASKQFVEGLTSGAVKM
jgi:ABC-type glycerol-3-phosphate transport system permease component